MAFEGLPEEPEKADSIGGVVEAVVEPAEPFTVSPGVELQEQFIGLWSQHAEEAIDRGGKGFDPTVRKAARNEPDNLDILRSIIAPGKFEGRRGEVSQIIGGVKTIQVGFERFLSVRDLHP